MPHSKNPASPDTENVFHRATLDNGLSIVVMPDMTVPNLTLFCGWRVGSRNERPGITGMSHLFEHMMFNGAKKYGAGEFDRVLALNGGYSNAYTCRDMTGYFECLPSDKLDVALDLELDRMKDLELSERNLESERKVVMEERRLTSEDSPFGVLHEHLYAAAYLAHPYRWPVIGWMDDIAAISVDDIQAYFRQHYVPGNAVVTLAGAVDPQAAIDSMAETLGRLPKGPAQPAVVRSEPTQDGERRVTMNRDTQLPWLALAWPVGDLHSPDLPALDVLQSILGDGESSRLQHRLVHELELAIEVHVDYPWALDPGLFSVYVNLRPGVDTARVEAAIASTLQEVCNETVSERELQKAKNCLRAGFYRRLKTNEGRADQLCSMTLLSGRPEALFELTARYDAVSLDEVQTVARATFREEARTVATLLPRKTKETSS